MVPLSLSGSLFGSMTMSARTATMIFSFARVLHVLGDCCRLLMDIDFMLRICRHLPSGKVPKKSWRTVVMDLRELTAR